MSVESNNGMPSLADLEAFINGTAYPLSAVQITPVRRASIFTLSPQEKTRSRLDLETSISTLAASAMTPEPSSRSSSFASAFPVEPPTPRPTILTGRGIDPAQTVLRPLPGYGGWIEDPGVQTPAVVAMKSEIEAVKELVVSRGISLHDISDAVQSGISIQELKAQTAKRVTFATQIEEVIPDQNQKNRGCCVVQ